MSGYVDIDDAAWIIGPWFECLECTPVDGCGEFGIATHFVGDTHPHTPVEALEGGAAAFGDVPEEGGDGG